MSAELATAGFSCVGCGYNLRGLSRDGVCPECGLAVSKSLRGDRLRAANPQWLARLVLGQRLLAGALQAVAYCALAAVLLPLGFAFLGAMASPPGPTVGNIMFIALLALVVCFVLSVLVAAAGAALLTTQEARVSLGESPWSDRNRARWGLLAAAAMIAFTQTLEWILPRTAGSKFIGVGMLVITTLVFSGAIVSLLDVLGDLARRVPHATLVKRTRKNARFFMWWPAAAILLVSLSSALRPAAPAGTVPIAPLSGIIGCVGLVLWLIILVQLFGLAQLMVIYRRVLQACHKRSLR